MTKDEIDGFVTIAAEVDLDDAPALLMEINSVVINVMSVLYARKLMEVCACPDCRDATKDMIEFETSKFNGGLQRAIDIHLQNNNLDPIFVSTTNQQTLQEILKEMESEQEQTKG